MEDLVAMVWFLIKMTFERNVARKEQGAEAEVLVEYKMLVRKCPAFHQGNVIGEGKGVQVV